MNLIEYIEKRKSLEELDLNSIIKKKYQDKKDNYTILKSVSDDNKIESKKFLLIKYLILLLPLLLVFVFITLSSDSENKQINIMYFLIFFVLVPVLFICYSSISLLTIGNNKRCLKELIKSLPNKYFDDIIKEGIKITSCFYFQLSSVIFSSLSIIALLFWTAIDNYKFYLATTWLPSNIFSSIIDFLSLPLKVIYPNLIPSKELIIQSYNIPNSDSTWVGFLITTVILWVILPRLVLLSVTFLFSRIKLKESFLKTTKSQRIIDYLNPKTSTTDNMCSSNYIDENDLKKKTTSIEENNNRYSKIILYHLNENAINVIKNSKKYENIDIITYNRKLDHKQFNFKLLILINYKSAPKMLAVNMMNKLKHCNIKLSFVDDDGKRIVSDPNIIEWERYLNEKNITYEVENGE